MHTKMIVEPIQTVSSNPQIVIQNSLKQRVLILRHYPVTAGHYEGLKLYCRTKQQLYWPYIEVYCYDKAGNCAEWANKMYQLHRIVGFIKLFSATKTP